MNRKIAIQKQRVGGANASKENARKLDKHIHLLEGRLDNALKRFNQSLARNKQLRTDIDSAREERVVYDSVYRKLERQIHKNNQRIESLQNEADQAIKARDAAKAELRKITGSGF